MNTFKANRKRQRQTKVATDNNENEPDKKRRKRRGVSVFQRQLYKRRIWVEEYEAGKMYNLLLLLIDESL